MRRAASLCIQVLTWLFHVLMPRQPAELRSEEGTTGDAVLFRARWRLGLLPSRRARGYNWRHQWK